MKVWRPGSRRDALEGGAGRLFAAEIGAAQAGEHIRDGQGFGGKHAGYSRMGGTRNW